MNRSYSRSARSYDEDRYADEAREPRRFARRSRRRADEPEENGFDGRHDAFDADEDRLEAVTRRLARETARRREEEDARRERSREYEPRGPARRDGSAAEEAAALVEKRVAAAERNTAKALENIAEMIESGQRRLDRDIVEEAVAALEERAGLSERKTAKAIENLAGLLENERAGRGVDALADRLQRIERKLEQTSVETAKPLRGALARLESRVEELSSEDRNEDFEQALRGLDRRLGDIARRLDEEAKERQQRAEELAKERQKLIDEECARERQQRFEEEERQRRRRAEEEKARETRLRLDAEARELQRRLDEDRTRLRREAEERAEQEPRVAAARPLASEPELRAAGAGLRRPLADAVAEIARRQRALDTDAERDLALLRVAPAIERPRVDAQRFDAAPLEPARVAPPAPATEPPRGFDELKGAIAAISQRLETADQTANERADQQLVVMRQLESLRREIESVSGALTTLTPRANTAAVESALRDLAHRIDAQRERGVDAATLAPVERIASELRGAIKELDPAPALRELQEDVRLIGARVETLRQQPESESAASIAQLQTSASEIKNLLTTLTARPLPLERLETRLFDLTQRVDGLALSGLAGAAPADLEPAVAAIRSIVGAEARAGYDAFSQRLERLGDKVDELLRNSGAERLAEISQRIDAMHKSLAQKLDEGAPAHAKALESLVANLGRKIDTALEQSSGGVAVGEIGAKIERLDERIDDIGRAISQQQALSGGAGPNAGFIDDLARRVGEKIDVALAPGGGRNLLELTERIDFMHHALAARIEEANRQRGDAGATQLGDLVEALTLKMNAALDAKTDDGALRALETQIEQLSRRLDRAGPGGVALESIERRLAELSDRIDQGGGGVDHVIERELADIRRAHDSAGLRTHETLSAVHDTLERVVDRIAVFEDELATLRTGASAPALAAAAPRAPLRVEPIKSAAALATPDDAIDGERASTRALRDKATPRNAPRMVKLDAGAAPAIDPDSVRAPASTQSDFIAAARRAAQQAAADAEAAEAQRTKRAAVKSESPEVAEPDAKAATNGGRRRPLLLGLGALVLLLGAYQVAKVSMEGPAYVEPASHGDSHGDVGAPAADAPAASAGNAAAARREADRGAESAPAPAPAAPAQTAPAAAARPATQPPSFTLPPSAVPPLGVQKPGGKSADAVDGAPTGSLGVANPSSPEAIAGLRAAAAQNDPAAQYELGARYSEGRGLARDPKIAAHWLEKAAEQGLAPAQYRLGAMYEKGVGVDRDYAKARKLYQRAAEAGNARAMHNLAVLAAEGGDAKPDYALAAEWFRKAAQYGVRDSQYNLAILYARGLGVPQNLSQSYQWFAVAAAQGDSDAAKKRDDIASRIDSKELAAARALVEQFHAATPERAANEVQPPRDGWEAFKPAPTPGKPEGAPIPARPKLSQI